MSTPSSPVAIRVTVEKGKAGGNEYFFTGPFKIGRDDDCEVQLADPKVSRFHAEVRFTRDRWWLIDLKSTNGTFVDGESKESIELSGPATVEFGRGGPVVSFTGQKVQTERKAHTVNLSLDQLQKHYFEERPDETFGAHTMMIRAVYDRLKKKQKRRYSLIIGALVCLAAISGAYAVWQHIEFNKQKSLAEDIFYTIKSFEIEFDEWLLVAEAEPATNPQVLEKVSKYEARRIELTTKYDQFMKRLDVYGKSKSEDIILSVARMYGESEVAMPAPFVKEVLNYVAKWKSTPRLSQAVERAKKEGYVDKIVEIMRTNRMPPQFFYLGLVESDFNVKACGPPTRFGIAKGMWQFIPGTAQHFGLHVGPLADQAKYDPEDQRHDFEKSTKVAAKYLRHIYDTLAQASGLLVMASYNWGEEWVRNLISTMPKNPKERNFWRLLTEYRDKIPQEIYDYVFYIFSATVIGENPGVFGFDFVNPLEPYIVKDSQQL
jgi:hypothetical protein